MKEKALNPKQTKKRKIWKKGNHKRLKALIFLTLLTPLLKGFDLHDFELIDSANPNSRLDCSDPTTLYLVSFRVKSFSGGKYPTFLLDPQSVSLPQELKAQNPLDELRDKYSTFKTGLDCYTPDNTNTINEEPFFALVAQQAQSGSNHCKLTNIITTKVLKSCRSSSTEYDMWDKVFLKIDGGLGSQDSFNKVEFHKDIRSLNHGTFIFKFKNLQLQDISVEIVEMMLIEPVSGIYRTSRSFKLYNWDNLKPFTQFDSPNTHTKPVEAQKYYKRLVIKDLPGYFLGGYDSSGSFSENEAIFQKVEPFDLGFPPSFHPRSYFFTIYCRKTSLISPGTTYTFHYDVKSFRESGSETTSLSDFSYKIEVKRTTTTTIEFKVLRNPVVAPIFIKTLTEEDPNQKYLYFTFMVGDGVKYYNSATQVRRKLFETLIIYRPGQAKVKELHSIELDSPLDKIYRTQNSQAKSRVVKIKFEMSSGGQVNTPGFRVYDCRMLDGAYPSQLISTVSNEQDFPACLLGNYHKGGCLSLAPLSSDTDLQADVVIDGGQLKTLSPENPLKEGCKVPMKVGSDYTCLIPKPGYISVLDSIFNGKLKDRVIPVAEYNKLVDEDKDFYYEYANSDGTKYLLNCYESCGACKEDQTCNFCLDGGSFSSGFCSNSGCENPYCTKCDGQSHPSCKWCKGSLFADPFATTNSEKCRSGGCLDGSGFLFEGFAKECRACVNNADCKKCPNFYQKCTECKQPQHFLVDIKYKDRFTPALTFEGIIDCFAFPSTPDYFYASPNKQLLPCKEGCKKCTNGNDCLECGSYSDPNKVFYLMKNGAETSCVESCGIADYRHEIAGAGQGEPNCIQCPAGYEVRGLTCMDPSSPQNTPITSESPTSQNPETPQNSETSSNQEIQTSRELKIIETSYTDSPSRVKVNFNQEIVSKLTSTTIKLSLFKKDNKTQVPVEFNSVEVAEDNKHLKIYFEVAEGIEDGLLRIERAKPYLILSKIDEKKALPEDVIEVKEISSYRPQGQLKAARVSSKTVSYTAGVLGVLSMLGSYTSMLDLVKSFQMIDFLAYLNVNYPSNLETFLKELELVVIEKLPNPLSSLRDDLCSIDKDKFEEQGVSCYILDDQGRYLALILLTFTLLVLLKILNHFLKTECLKSFLSEKFKLSFFGDFLEAIRLDILITVLLSITKLTVAGKKPFSIFSLNLCTSICFTTVNIVFFAYQIHKIKQSHTKHKKSNNREQSSKKTRLGTSRQQDDSTHRKINQDASIEPLGQSTLHRSGIEAQEPQKSEIDPQANQLTLDPCCQFNEDYKTEFFYQRNHKPLMLLKDILLSTILVCFYWVKAVQTTGVTLTLGAFLALDVYYKPFKDSKENLDLIVNNTVFLMISTSLTVLGFTQRILSRKLVYYLIGYSSILLILILILKNLFGSVVSAYKGIKKISENCFSRKKSSSPKKKNKVFTSKKKKKKGIRHRGVENNGLRGFRAGDGNRVHKGHFDRNGGLKRDLVTPDLFQINDEHKIGDNGQNRVHGGQGEHLELPSSQKKSRSHKRERRKNGPKSRPKPGKRDRKMGKGGVPEILNRNRRGMKDKSRRKKNKHHRRRRNHDVKQ